MQVLVVVADAERRAAILGSLERHRFEATGLGDAVAAGPVVDAGRIEVLVVEQQALADDPGLLGGLRQRRPDLYVIALLSPPGGPDGGPALPAGVDDFVQQPVSPEELTLRLQLARQRRRDRAGEPETAPAIIRTGPLHLDAGARVATVGAHVLDLTRLEFDLLWHFVRNPGRTFERAELLRAVWASSAEWQTTATVTEHVRRLRKKLEVGPGLADRIATVRGVGYRFEPEDLPVAPGPQPPPRTAPVATSALTAGERDAVVVILGSNRIAAASPAALDLLGATDERQVLGRHIWSFIAPRSLEAVVARRLCTRVGRVPRPDVLTLARLDGTERAVQVASTPVLWDAEVASQINLWDVDAEAASRRELTPGFDVVEPAVIVTDQQSRIQSFNPPAEALYGWTEAEVLGRVAFEVLPWVRDDAFARQVEEDFVRDGRWEGEVVHRRRDGALVPTHLSAAMLVDDDGGFVGIVQVYRPR